MQQAGTLRQRRLTSRVFPIPGQSVGHNLTIKATYAQKVALLCPLFLKGQQPAAAPKCTSEVRSQTVLLEAPPLVSALLGKIADRLVQIQITWQVP